MGAGDRLLFTLARAGLRKGDWYKFSVSAHAERSFPQLPLQCSTVGLHCCTAQAMNALFLPRVVSVSNASSIDYNLVHR